MRYGIRQRAEFPLARLERGLGVFAFGDLLSRDVDTHDLTIGAAQRVPVCDPQAFADLISALAGDLNAGHRLARFHNRPDDVFDGVGQSRHALAYRTSDMCLDRQAAYFSEALVDPQIAAVGRQECKANRRCVIDQLKGGLLREW